MTLEHVNSLQTLDTPPASVGWICEACTNPTPSVHEERDGSRVCSECHRIGKAVREYVRAERLAVIRARRVLAREGIAGYGEAK